MPAATIPCRYCGLDLSFKTQPEPFLIQVACHRCRYINLVEQSRIELAVQDCYRRLPPSRKLPDFEPSQDSRTVHAYLHTIANALLDTLIERVHLDLPVVRSSLVPILSRREQIIRRRISGTDESDTSVEPKIFPNVCNLLWGVITEAGGLSSEAIRNSSSKGVAHFLAWFDEIAYGIVNIATTAKLMRRRELQPSFDGLRFTFTTTPRHTAMVECLANKKRSEEVAQQVVRVEEFYSREALEAQRLVLGFNSLDIVELASNGFANLRARTTVVQERGLYWIKVPQEDSELRRLILCCTQTLPRLREFYSPLFFDLGIRAEPPMSDREAILNAAARNWSFYYPFCSMSEVGGEAEYVCTSPGIMSHFLINLEMQRNALTERLISESKASSREAVAEELAMLVKRGSHRLERAACDIAHSSGWMASGTPSALPCGDIDAVAVRETSEGEVLVVVCEVKDADLPGHREDAYEHQGRTMAKAISQLDRKAKWVADNWLRGFGSSLFPSLRSHQQGVIVKVLVTRNHSPLELNDGTECVPLPGLKRFFSELTNGLPPWFEGTRRASVLRFRNRLTER